MGATSTPGQGSTFGCELPLAIDCSVRSTRPETGAAVLVIDELEFSRHTTARQLSAIGLRPHSCSSESEALDALRGSTPFPLGVIQLRSGDLDWKRIVETSRNERAHGDTRWILVTQIASLPVVASHGGSTETELRPTTHSPRAQPPVETGGSRRVLLVEDNLVNQKVATRLLAKLGCRVEVAGDGVEALEILATQSFAFIFMDCQMPRMDGYQTTQAVRALDDPQLASMPIIAMTANAMKGDREKCLEAGMEYYLSKPVTKEKLASMLDLLRSKLAGETSDSSSL